jgi:hypothetical protein
VERTEEIGWQAWQTLDDVTLVPYDAFSTEVVLGSGSPIVHEGNLSVDDRGERQAALFFPSNLSASLRMPDGSSQAFPSGSFHVRVTEYSVGDNYLETAPATLPETGFYAYGAEVSVDECAFR